MGVDIGSAVSKCVILRTGEEITASANCQGGTGIIALGKAVQKALNNAGLSILSGGVLMMACFSL